MLDLLIPYRFKKYTSLIGSLLIHLSLGSFYTFGNLSPYMISYLRVQDGLNYRYSDSVYILTTLAMCLSLGTVISGAMISFLKFRIKTVIFIGSACVSAGCLLTYFTIKSSYILTLITYGLINGIGAGFCYMSPLALVMKWFPSAKGFANSVVLFGFGAGPMIFNQIQTIYINPKNYSPDKPYAPGSDEKYFSQPDLLARVPKLFLIQGFIYLGLEVIGLLIMAEYYEQAPDSSSQEAINQVESEASAVEDSEMVKSPDVDEINSLGVRYKTLEGGMEFKEAIKTLPFYLIVLMISLSTLGANCVITFYKTFGQTFISDDRFLAITGSVGAIFNSTGRLFWGYLMDRVPFKLCFLTITTILIAIISTVYLNKYIDIKLVYMMWICGLFFVNCGIYTVIPTIVAKTFGQKHFNAIYGFIYFLGIPANFIASELPKLINLFGWFPFFIVGALFSMMGWMCGFIFNVKNSNGDDL